MPQNLAKDEVNIGRVGFQWVMKEYETFNRSKRWYVLMGLLGILCVAYAIWTQNYLFALIIMLFAIILFLQGNQEPMEIPFAITSLGIVVGNNFYKYSELAHFWMIYNPPQVKNLYFGFKSFLKHRLKVPLMDYDPRPIKDFLNQYLQEDLEAEEEPLSDRLSRLFKIQ